MARIKVTLLRWLLRCSRRASAPVMMMVLPVRVGMRAASGRGGPRAIGTDAAQTEDTAAGRLRSQRRHFLEEEARQRNEHSDRQDPFPISPPSVSDGARGADDQSSALGCPHAPIRGRWRSAFIRRPIPTEWPARDGITSRVRFSYQLPVAASRLRAGVIDPAINLARFRSIGSGALV